MKCKKFIMTIFFSFMGLLYVTSSVLAGSANYTPPAKKGNIYTVIAYKKSKGTFMPKPNPASLSVKWGNWKKSGTIKPQLGGVPIGFVLKLKHSKNDSVPLSITTDGEIKTRPYQGDPPPEWNKGGWKRVSW